MNRGKVYLAGPMTGYPDYNYPAFYQGESILMAKGFQVVNPAKLDSLTTMDLLDAGLDPDAPGGLVDGSALPVYLRRDFKELVHCDGIVLLDGWHDSAGANAELAVACWMDLDKWRLSERYGWSLRPTAAIPNRGVVVETWHRFARPSLALQERYG